eukprot:4879644-Amphidinium_carterae.3
MYQKVLEVGTAQIVHPCFQFCFAASLSKAQLPNPNSSAQANKNKKKAPNIGQNCSGLSRIIQKQECSCSQKYKSTYPGRTKHCNNDPKTLKPTLTTLATTICASNNIYDKNNSSSKSKSQQQQQQQQQTSSNNSSSNNNQQQQQQQQQPTASTTAERHPKIQAYRVGCFFAHISRGL